IRERLKQIRDLLKFARFRPSAKGIANIDAAAASAGGLPGQDGFPHKDRDTSRGGKAGRSGDIFALFAPAGGEKADPVDSLLEPESKWITEKDGSRTPGNLDNRAARYLLDQNLLLINADFRAFTDMVDRWVVAYAHVSGAQKVIQEVVHEWFQQQ